MRTWNRDEIASLTTEDLLAIVRSTNPATEKFRDELAWAKAELARRRADN